jgi:hypothetical protein
VASFFSGAVSALVTVVVTGWAAFGLIDAMVGFYPPNDLLQRPPWSKVSFDVIVRHWGVHKNNPIIKVQKAITPIITKVQIVRLLMARGSQFPNDAGFQWL